MASPQGHNAPLATDFVFRTKRHYPLLCKASGEVAAGPAVPSFAIAYSERVEYFVYCRDRPGTAALRDELVEAHWSFMRG